MDIQPSSLSGRLGALGHARTLFRLCFAVLAVLLTVQLIRLALIIATPLGPVGDWKAQQSRVLPPQARLTLFQSFDPFFRAGAEPGANVVTSLQLTLFGIRMNAGSGLGSAILAGPDGVQSSYAVGEEIMAGVTLSAVEFDHVVISRGGVRESLYLDQSVPAQTVGSDPVPANIPPAALAAAMNVDNMAALAPRTVDGKVTGIVMAPQGDGALFKAAGFRDGDIIVSVNGRPVSAVADIAALKSQAVPGARLSVMVERGADTVPVAVDLGNLGAP